VPLLVDVVPLLWRRSAEPCRPRSKSNALSPLIDAGQWYRSFALGQRQTLSTPNELAAAAETTTTTAARRNEQHCKRERQMMVHHHHQRHTTSVCLFVPFLSSEQTNKLPSGHNRHSLAV